MAEPVKRGAAAVAAAIAMILGAVYAHEGGYVNDRRDPGGPTHFGVTQAVAREAGFTGDMRDFPQHCRSVAPADICADKIYIAQYIEAPGYMPIVALEPAVAEELVDTAVNMGPARPSSWFQDALNGLGRAGLTVDGRIGLRSIAAYEQLQGQLGPAKACAAMLDALDRRQLAEYQRLVRVRPANKAFYRGWVTHRIGNVDRAKCAHL